MDKQIPQLLSKLSSLVAGEKNKQEEKRNRGEAFNVFSLLKMESNETATHSAILAELLNPHGSHGCGNAFLSAFLRQVALDVDLSLINLEEAEIEVEKIIGCKNEDATEGGRIDITINLGNRLFIIENKIYAQDQIHQLLRYDNYAKSTSKAYKLFYLTLDGKDASEASTTDAQGNEAKYISLSYKEHILMWLDQCVRIAFNKPLVRETLVQYIEIIKKLTHQDMDTNFSEEVVGAALDNIDAAWALIANQEQIKQAFWEKNIFVPLKQLVADKGLRYDLWREAPEDNNMIVLQKEGWTGWILIDSTHSSLWKEMSIGLTFKKQTKIQEKLECLSDPDVSGGWWPYGRTVLPLDIRNWTDFETFGNIKKCNNIISWLDQKIDEIVSEVEDKRIMEKERFR